MGKCLCVGEGGEGRRRGARSVQPACWDPLKPREKFPTPVGGWSLTFGIPASKTQPNPMRYVHTFRWVTRQFSSPETDDRTSLHEDFLQLLFRRFVRDVPNYNNVELRVDHQKTT